MVVRPCFHGWPGEWSVAVDDGHSGLWHVFETGLLDQRLYSPQFRERVFSGARWQHGQHRVRLAPTEGSLQLDDGLATPAAEPLDDLRE